jgi:uncharacterized membrane protein YhaH (DUF805 family)
MDIKTAVETVVMKKYANFEGRAIRSEYWWYVLAYIIAAIVVGVIDAVLGIGMRRLHDLDKSGWWLLLALIPLLGALVLLFFFVQRGTVGDNRFGPDPLAAA